MRRGEVAGLTREDLDLDKEQLRVSWTLGIVNNRLTWQPRPKSKAGERLIALDPATVDAPRQPLADQAAERLAVGSRWPARQYDWQGEYRDDPIFTWSEGTLISPDRFSAWFRQARGEARLRPMRLHDVRHTYATVSLTRATGWHEVKVISQRLGHSSIGFTLDTYSHVLPSADEETANTLALARHILGGAA